MKENYQSKIYPIVAYGDPILKQKAEDLDLTDPTLPEIIANMFETMYNAQGVGLAGPQVGMSKRIFVIDSSLILEEDSEEVGLKGAFINAEKIDETGEDWPYSEGCLSIPEISEQVTRPECVKLRYYDENMELQEKVFDGMTARVIQHEYDHIDGVLFTDHLNPLRKKLLKRKLTKITKGDIKPKYKMRFHKKKARV